MAKTIPEIKNFNELLLPYLGQDTKIINYTSKLLNAAGENYGSLMLSVDVTVEKSGQSTENINIIAKLCPPNEWLKRMFASHITFKKEISFYKQLVPTLIKFQKEHNVPESRLLNIFPDCLNARINLNPASDSVDDNAVLLLENLRIKGYKCQDRLIGLNLEETELVLKDLARYHAVPLAFKLRNPQQFKDTIMAMLNRVVIGQEMFDIGEGEDKFNESITRHLNLSENDLKRFTNGMSKGYDFQKHFPAGNEKYATMVHCDFWLNNTMIKYENGKPVKNKMLDFQVSTYGSPATDLVFFLYTSVSQPVFDKYYDHFISVYHDAFVECLQDLHCDITPYTLDSFKKEIEHFGPLEASHILIMYKAVFGDKGKAKEMDDISLDDMFTDDSITDIYKQRLTYTVNNFFTKNWF